MTYDLRRLRLHGLIERIPSTHRYRVTDEGLRAALFFNRFYARALRPALSQPASPYFSTRGTKSLQRLDDALEQLLQEARLAA
jgi:hypothetical protein